ncbi:MAG: SH3 domain-containing protein, partial [Chloroflexi bacterium]|nr:SH3 domain-containing protein [Chloroflexota bacterium]
MTHRGLKLKVVGLLFIAVLTVSLAGNLLPVDRAAAQGYPTATVNTGALNVRSGPGVGYGVQTSIPRGTAATLLARNADTSWVQIQLSSGLFGWVNARYLATTYPLYSLPIGSGSQPVQATATVTSYALNIRSGPGISYTRVTAVYRGTGLILLARNSDASWVRVTLPDGSYPGWVNSGYISTTYPLVSLPVEYVTQP